MQNNYDNNQDKSQYVDNATFVNQVLQENQNIKKTTLQMGISKLKKKLFNGKAEKDFNQQEKQKFSEERQKLADKYKKQAIISSERKEGKYVSDADFLEKVCKENPNVNPHALQIAISRLKKKLFNGKAEYNFNQQEKQQFSEERQKLADKYKKQAIIGLERKERNEQYVSNADFIKEFCKENKIMDEENLTSAISKLKCKLFGNKSEALFTQDDIERWQKSRLDKANKLLSTLYTRKNVDELCQENPNINKSHMLQFVKRKRNKKEKSSGQPTNEEGIKEIISEYNPKPPEHTYCHYTWVDDFCEKYTQDKKSVIIALQNLVSREKAKEHYLTESELKQWLYEKHANTLWLNDYCKKTRMSKQKVWSSISNKISETKKGKGTTMSRSDAIEWFLKKYPLQESKQQSTQQINNNINLEEKNNDLMQVGCKNMNTDNYKMEKNRYNYLEDLKEKSDGLFQGDKMNIETDNYKMEKYSYEDLEEDNDCNDYSDLSQKFILDMEKMNGSEMSENNFKYINNNSSSTKKLSNNLENNLK